MYNIQLSMARLGVRVPKVQYCDHFWLCRKRCEPARCFVSRTSSGSGQCTLRNVSSRGPVLPAHCTSSGSGLCTLCNVSFRGPGLPAYCTSSGSGPCTFMYCIILGPWLPACVVRDKLRAHCITDCQPIATFIGQAQNQVAMSKSDKRKRRLWR
jgi:hypothetical protein